MSKYEPLGIFLRKQTRSSIPMTFREIEQVVGGRLPGSKKHRAWWSNNPSNNVMTHQWLGAGYETESVDIAGEKLVFRRARRPVANETPASSDSSPDGVSDRKRHPIFGCMKGTITISPGVDITQPADPEWGKVYEDE